jgi:hypothetical protein
MKGIELNLEVRRTAVVDVLGCSGTWDRRVELLVNAETCDDVCISF